MGKRGKEGKTRSIYLVLWKCGGAACGEGRGRVEEEKRGKGRVEEKRGGKGEGRIACPGR